MNSPLTSDPWIGRTINDGGQSPAASYRQRYRLDKRLGAGGMGDVFLAMDTLLGKQVALKLLKDTLVASEALRNRFEREVAVCAALKSDNIVQVSDYGVTPEAHPFYVMEYLRGQSLGQLLRQQQRLDVKRTVNIISQVCEGLQLAHEGVTLWRDSATASEHVLVVHRDLKPDNIFLVPTALGELVKILDFGIAKFRSFDTAEQTNLTGMFIGTFHYASPEQLAAETDLDGRSDIYSLGIILYEMLSGTDPFGLGLNINYISGMSWALAHSSKAPTPLRSQPGCEQLSPELEAVVMRCLQKVPRERWKSVDELKRALQAAVAVPISPVPPNTVIDDRKIIPSNTLPPRKFPLLLNGAGIAIAITAIGTAYAYLNWLPNKTITLDEIKELQAEAKYAQCITKVKTVTKDLNIYVKAQELLHQCQIEQAKKLAAENNFAEAITAASTIPKDSMLYSKAQQLSLQWSNHIITQATAQFQAGNLDTAIAQVEAIPANSPVHQKAQAAIAQWQKNWQVAETQFSAAKSALDEGKWHLAINTSNKVPNISYWKQKIQSVVQEAQSQIAKAEAAAKADVLPAYESAPLQILTGAEPAQANPPSPLVQADNPPAPSARVDNPPAPSARVDNPSAPPAQAHNSAPSAPKPPADGGWEDSATTSPADGASEDSATTPPADGASEDSATTPPADGGWEDSAPEPSANGGWEDSAPTPPADGASEDSATTPPADGGLEHSTSEVHPQGEGGL